MPVLFRKETLALRAKNRPENVNHAPAGLQRFVEESKIQEETGEEETVVCGCRHFRPVPHGMYRTVACFVTGSSPVPLKTRRVGQRCTLNLSRAETSSRWCGVVVRRGGASSGVVHVT
ncbi:uncharacterized protein TNCV_4570161 [Trichonephila clavipes]|nr:uncharacterized protein TNCV_4570161 [Trichonephila clavipes]